MTDSKLIAEHLKTLAKVHTKREGHPCFDYAEALGMLYPNADKQAVFEAVLGYDK